MDRIRTVDSGYGCVTKARRGDNGGRNEDERRRGMWAKAIAEGRCLVPVRAFYESHATERVVSERTGKPVRRQYLFRLPGARAFLLAAVREGDRFSIVTTTPNASVAPIHNRMPLVLGPGESGMWLGPDFLALGRRDGISLISRPESQCSRD